ncbi:MAG: hypothetical protein WC717_04860 [Candidatus Micrarchaeia archaeon]|jgi:hypothetical protein
MEKEKSSGQISAELMVTVSSMVLLLLVIYIVNDSVRFTWAGQKETLEASTAANQVALAINRAAAGGDGTQVKFNNFVGDNIENITISPPRAVRAATTNGFWSSTPIITNSTNVSGTIPINQELVVRNINGVITVAAG